MWITKEFSEKEPQLLGNFCSLLTLIASPAVYLFSPGGGLNNCKSHRLCLAYTSKSHRFERENIRNGRAETSTREKIVIQTSRWFMTPQLIRLKFRNARPVRLLNLPTSARNRRIDRAFSLTCSGVSPRMLFCV